MILIKADEKSEAGILPDEKLLTEMGKYNGTEPEIEIRPGDRDGGLRRERSHWGYGRRGPLRAQLAGN